MGGSQLAVSDLALPRGTARNENGQWTLGNVTLSLRPLRLGAKADGVLIATLRVPEGEGASLGSWRVVAAVGRELKLVLSLADEDPDLGMGRVTIVDQVVHFTHDSPSGEERPDRFDDAAWDWAGELRRLQGATLFALAVAAAPALEEARRAQHALESRCRELGSLRAYPSAQFEGLPQSFFAGKVFLRRAEAQAALDRARACGATVEIFETAFVATPSPPK